ncbi:MAG: hypothetical protein O3C40_19855 [Planctomycetota bacterium]|nr:hypothetical protein [Planctomycetota bacterium]
MMSSMRKVAALLVVSVAVVSVPLLAQDHSWTKVLKDRTKRDTLHDGFLKVRGDSGKWNDEPRLQHAPPMQQKPADVSLDDWADQLLAKEFKQSRGDDHWLLFRTQQLDDNDRVWIERIERRENRFTVVVSQAVWQGRYSKNFTYYNVYGVNLGKLEPGKYQANWNTKTLVFSNFDGTGRPPDNWPKDERVADQEPSESSVSFTVVATPQ